MNLATVLGAALGALLTATTLAARLVLPTWFTQVVERDFAASATRVVGVVVFFGCGFVPLLALAAMDPRRTAHGWPEALAATTTALTVGAGLLGGLRAARRRRQADQALADHGLDLFTEGPGGGIGGEPGPLRLVE